VSRLGAWAGWATVAAVMVLSFIGSTRPAAADPTTPTTAVTIPASPSITVPDSLTTIPPAGTPTTAAPSDAPTPPAPAAPSAPAASGSGSGSVSINLGNAITKPSESLEIIIALTLLSIAPALLIMMTSFTRVIIVLSLTRQALGLQTVPPNQVLAGLALFISLFIMGPTISQMNQKAVQPYLNHKITADAAYTAAQAPLKTWMLKQTRQSELEVFIGASTGPKPKTPADVGMATLIPAFILSEIKAAFIIGFVIFIPFLVIDLIVSSSLMSMGMMMLPPVLVSLPFKILLFVLVDGWALVVKSLITSYR
jgi:flagellar biosynthetic protein FliP